MAESAAPSPQDAACEVAIVGAGPTGLMAASLLRRCGVGVRLLDKSQGPVKESRALALQARSLELFLSMGLDQDILDRGVIASGLNVVVSGKPAVTVTFDDIGRTDTPFAFPFLIPQSETEAVLVDDVRRLGVAIEYGTEVVGVEQDEAGVTVRTLREGVSSTVRAVYAIGADGAHSIVRKSLGLSFQGAAYAQNFLLADCAVAWPFADDRISLFLHGRDFAAFMPIRGLELGRIIAIDPGHGKTSASIESQGSSEVTLAEVETAMRNVTQSDVRLSNPIWTSRYRVHHRGVDRYRVGRVFVAGDAAHIHSPAGGQGMNTGLQDAANLAWKLAVSLKEPGSEALLDSYHGERWPVGRKVLERTDRMFSTMTELSPFAAEVRNIALPLMVGPVMRSRIARAKAFDFISELGIAYDESLAAQNPSEAHPPALPRVPAGARAPDGQITRTTSAFDLLAGYRFTLLALSWTPLAEAGIAAADAMLRGFPDHLGGIELRRHLVARSLIGRDPRLVTAEATAVFSSYGLDRAVPQGLVLVRPDGYVGFSAASFADQSLRAYLARVFPTS